VEINAFGFHQFQGEEPKGSRQLLEGKGRGGGAASIPVRRRWPEEPIAEGANIERRWRRSCSVRQPEVGEGFMGLGWAQRSNGP
jgi:hypothetical protein